MQNHVFAASIRSFSGAYLLPPQHIIANDDAVAELVDSDGQYGNLAAGASSSRTPSSFEMESAAVVVGEGGKPSLFLNIVPIWRG